MAWNPAAWMVVVALSATVACGELRKEPEELSSEIVAVQGVVIRNQLPYQVSGVQILATRTGRFVGCGLIMSGTFCRMAFDAQALYGSDIIVSWEEHGKPHSSGEVQIEQPANLVPDKAAWVEVLIFAPGQVGARLIQ
ncbi:MAG: hypothetical protein RQ826_01895 [Xanthomonadales bacterium]|nr:hypothetical protein [Xanthomonadales bacterium]